MASTKQQSSGGGNVPPRPNGAPTASAVPKRPTGKPSSSSAPKPGRPPQRTSARRMAEQRRKRNILTAAGAVGVIVVVIAVVVVLKVTGNNSTPTGTADAGTFPLSSSLTSPVENVPVSALVAATKSPPSGTNPAQKLPATAEALTSDGKPEILYMGAEYCPFCAAERWALVMALSKFGTFTGLKGTTSSSIDTNPSTPTFSFYGSTYKSKYISFDPVEMQTNAYSASLGNYPTLQTPTATQNAILTKWDVSPYTSENGSIPFVYLGGKYLVTGAQYLASPLSGKSFQTAVPYMTSGTNATSRGAEAAAGYLVAEILALTHDQPASVAAQVPDSLKGVNTSSGSSGSRSTPKTTPTTAKSGKTGSSTASTS
jgi:thiol-disulfide isomerase/thioredoxin